MSTERNERFRRAAAEAAANLGQARARAAQRSGPPAPGDLYVLGRIESAALEWLVVRAHPDDPALLLVVPADDFPLIGPPDLELPRDPVRRRLTARCGQGLWVPAALLEARRRVASLAIEAVPLVRQKLAALARGRVSAS